MHPLGDKHQSLFQHNPLGHILGCGLLFPSNPICLPCSRKSSSFLVDRGCPFLFSQGYLHLILFLPVIFLKGKTHHLKCTVLWFYMHNVQPLPLSISRTFTPPREFLCDNRKWIISFQNCESLRCIPETYTIVHRLYFNKKRNPLSPNSPLLPSPGNH